LLGTRVNALSFTRLFRRPRTRIPATFTEHRGSWYRLSELVMRKPVPVALGVLMFLLVLVWPFLHITFATPDENILPAGQPARVVSQRIAQDFAQQGNAQLIIAIKTPGDALSAANLANLDRYVRSIAALPGVAHVTSLVTARANMSLAEYRQVYAWPASN